MAVTVFALFPILIVVFAITPSRIFIVYKVLGFSNASISGEGGITVAESAKYYGVFYPIDNPLSSDQTVSRIILTVELI